MDEMTFEEKINSLENSKNKFIYLIKDGNTPVMLTAVHTVNQIKETGIKHSEPYTSAICQYIASKVDTHFMIKSIDNGIDSNSLVEDDFKIVLDKKIKDKGIKLLIDIHGASFERDFDVEFGTLRNMTIDITAQKSLEDSFYKNGISNIKYNDPFCGGGITRYIYENNFVDIIQIEIHAKYRNYKELDKCEKVCNALVDFIKKYTAAENIG